jgi:hypothetical protein
LELNRPDDLEFCSTKDPVSIIGRIDELSSVVELESDDFLGVFWLLELGIGTVFHLSHAHKLPDSIDSGDKKHIWFDIGDIHFGHAIVRQLICFSQS